MEALEAHGTWLCRTPFDRERLLDMEAKLGPARAVMYGSLAAAFVASIPWFGWWVILPLAWVVLFYQLVRGRIFTSPRPEYVVALTIVHAQVMLALGVVLTGGPESPVLPVLLLPIVTLPARFDGRGVIAGVAITVLILLCAAIGADPSGYAENPTLVNVCVACCVGLAGFAHVLMRAEAEQRADAILDPLTGLLNRKALRERFAEIGEQAALTGGSVALVACDLDRFKNVNDEYGHDRGDAVLKDAAYLLRKHLRTFELVYRVGGEEFLVVLPGIDAHGAAALAERLRVAIESGRPGGLELTISAGVAAASGSAVSFEELFREADEALYEAKRAGRNRVVLFADESLLAVA